MSYQPVSPTPATYTRVGAGSAAYAPQSPTSADYDDLPATWEAQFLDVPYARFLLAYDGAERAPFFNANGASRANGRWEIGTPDTVLDCETQKNCYYVIASALIDGVASRLDLGLKAIEWTFADAVAGPLGNFPQENGAPIPVTRGATLGKCIFMATAGRSLLLLQQSQSPLITAAIRLRVADLVTRYVKSARWLSTSEDLLTFIEPGRAFRPRNMNQVLFASIVMRIGGYLGNDAAITAVAFSVIRNALTAQWPDGTFPERKPHVELGFDPNYQTVSMELLATWLLLHRRPWLDTEFTNPLRRGVNRWLSQVAADGTFLESPGTRTVIIPPNTPGPGPKANSIDQYPLKLLYCGMALGEDYSDIAVAIERQGQFLDHY